MWVRWGRPCPPPSQLSPRGETHEAFGLGGNLAGDVSGRVPLDGGRLGPCRRRRIERKPWLSQLFRSSPAFSQSLIPEPSPNSAVLISAARSALRVDGRTHGWDWRVLPGRADRQHALRGNGERPLRRDRLNRNPDRRRIDVLYTVIYAMAPGADAGCSPGLCEGNGG